MTLLYNDTFIIFRYRLSQDIIHRGIVIDCRNGGIAFHFDDRGRLGLVQRVLDALVLGALTGASYFQLGFAGQPVAHTDGLWNGLGMLLAGFGCVLLGGCPLRQLILAGEGNADSAIAVLGLLAGAAFSHNFGLASSTEGPTAGGKIAVLIGIAAVAVIAAANTFKKEA